MTFTTQAQPQQEHNWGTHCALTAILGIRKDVGCRLLSPTAILFAAAAIVAMPYAIDCFYGEPLDFNVLLGIGVAVAVRGFWLRRKHLAELKAGTSTVQSYETGKSVLLGVLPLPQNVVHCVVDPLVVAGAGWVVMRYVSAPFGIWMVICAACFAVVECGAQYRARQALLDTHDSFRDGDRQRRMADHVAPAPDAWTQPGSGATASTGMDDDIEELLRRHQ